MGVQGCYLGGIIEKRNHLRSYQDSSRDGVLYLWWVNITTEGGQWANLKDSQGHVQL